MLSQAQVNLWRQTEQLQDELLYLRERRQMDMGLGSLHDQRQRQGASQNDLDFLLTKSTAIAHAVTMANKDRMVVVAQVQKRYEIMLPYLSERTKRAWAAAEALAIGRGGNAIVAEAVGLSRTTLTKAKQEVLSQVGRPVNGERGVAVRD